MAKQKPRTAAQSRQPLSNTNAGGETSSGGTAGAMSGAGSGASTGALVGSAFGPAGTGIGAVVGGLAGGIGGWLAGRRRSQDSRESILAALGESSGYGRDMATQWSTDPGQMIDNYQQGLIRARVLEGNTRNHLGQTELDVNPAMASLIPMMRNPGTYGFGTDEAGNINGWTPAQYDPAFMDKEGNMLNTDSATFGSAGPGAGASPGPMPNWMPPATTGPPQNPGEGAPTGAGGGMPKAIQNPVNPNALPRFQDPNQYLAAAGIRA
jgi:hypothetical protein